MARVVVSACAASVLAPAADARALSRPMRAILLSALAVRSLATPIVRLFADIGT